MPPDEILKIAMHWLDGELLFYEEIRNEVLSQAHTQAQDDDDEDDK